VKRSKRKALIGCGVADQVGNVKEWVAAQRDVPPGARIAKGSS